MRYLAAYLLLTVGGNAKPTVEDVSNVLSQAGIETDAERIAALFTELEGKDINELVALGKAKLMVGGAMAAASAAPAAGAEGIYLDDYIRRGNNIMISNLRICRNLTDVYLIVLPSLLSVAAPVAKEAAKPVEEEVDALDGGMDMFGGGGAKTGDY